MANHRSFPALLILAALSSVPCGCSSLGIQFRSPITSIPKEPRFGPGKLSPAAIQSQIMSFTDTFNAVVSEQWNRVAAEGRAKSSPEGFVVPDAEQDHASRLRRSAVENKLATVSAALSIASSPNPTVALADMITMVTLQRMVLEGPNARELYGDELAEALIQTYRDQEEAIWKIGNQAMRAELADQLKELINEWREEHPDANYVANVRLEDFAKARQQPLVSAVKSGDNLLTLLALDPLAGLDPAQREVQQSRMLGERMFYYASRSPQVLKWHVESLYQSLLRAPELKQLLVSLEKATDSAARISTVAEQLPEHVAAERSAALDQLFVKVAEERSAAIENTKQALAELSQSTLTDIDQAQDKFHGTLSQFQQTLDATDKTAVSLTAAIQAADAFAARFARPPGSPPSDPNRNVFADYTNAVAQTGEAADRLTLLAQNIDRLVANQASGATSAPLHSALADAQSSVQQVIDHAFLKLLILAIVTPLAVAAAAILYRRATRRVSTPSLPRTRASEGVTLN